MNIPPVTWGLLVANLLAYFLQQLAPGLFIPLFALWPLGNDAGPSFLPWQIFTYGFLHGNMLHLIFNMFGLYMFGREVELLLGTKRYLIYYLTCVASGGAMQLLIMGQMADASATLGASAGVLGVLFAFGMAYPRRIILLIFPPIPMPAWVFVTLFILLDLYLGLTGSRSGVAHFAHLGGMLGGYLLLRHWRSNRPRRR